jgi:hypothetical protein
MGLIIDVRPPWIPVRGSASILEHPACARGRVDGIADELQVTPGAADISLLRVPIAT